MNKTLLTALFVGLASAGKAQSIAAGTTALGGAIGYSSQMEKVSSSFRGTNYSDDLVIDKFNIELSIGHFIANNLAIGLLVEHETKGGSYKSTTNSGSNLLQPPKSNKLRIGPFVQYYKMLSEQFGFTGTLSGGYESAFQQLEVNRGGYPSGYPIGYIDQSAKGYYGAITPGIVFFPVPKFGLTATIGSLDFSRLNVKAENLPSEVEDVASTLSARFGLSQLQFGGGYYFGR